MVKGGYSLSSKRPKNSQLKRQKSVEIQLSLTLMQVKLVYYHFKIKNYLDLQSLGSKWSNVDSTRDSGLRKTSLTLTSLLPLTLLSHIFAIATHNNLLPPRSWTWDLGKWVAVMTWIGQSGLILLDLTLVDLRINLDSGLSNFNSCQIQIFFVLERGKLLFHHGNCILANILKNR